MPSRKVPDKFLVAFSFAGEQRDLVRKLAEDIEERLGEGKVFFDEWFEYYIAGDDADLRLQDIYAKRSVLVVVCVSERYGDKSWTKAEFKAIRSLQMLLYETSEERERSRILPLRVGDGDVPGIFENTICPDVRNRPREEIVQLVFGRLGFIDPAHVANAADSARAPSWPAATSLEWPVADHEGARDCFATLLTCAPPWRLLCIRGPSETGKSHITRQMLGNALRVPDLACGRFDFKGTTDMEAELRAFVQDLGVPLPQVSPRLNDRLALVLDALKQRARPALLILDTYEAAGEALDWVEKQLLPSIVRNPWLRVVIAGQRVPSAAGALWASVASRPLELAPPPPEDWLTFGRKHKPDIDLDFVRQAHHCCGGRSSVLAQLVGPTP
jgi:hypothetical protein